MVTTEVAQLSKECNAWRETLRSYRDEFGRLKGQLQEAAGRQTHKEDLLQVEHLDNQLHIQLINIHDVKQSIKAHERQIQRDLEMNDGKVTDSTLGSHEQLFDEFQSLEHTLQELKQEFEHFILRTN